MFQNETIGDGGKMFQNETIGDSGKMFYIFGACPQNAKMEVIQ